MKVNVYDVKGNVSGKMDLPKQFSETVRLDLIKKAVITHQKNRIQPYGASLLAGRKSSAKFSGIRRGYGHSYNWSVARLPRLMIRGGRRIGRVVNVPQAVGGPRAHPPKVERVWKIRMNRKERRLAIRSALAATAIKEMVLARGHRVGDVTLPVVVDGLESLGRTRQVRELLLALSLEDELERAGTRKIRAGKGKMRGRKYKSPKSILFVVSDPHSSVVKAVRNLPGVDVVSVSMLNAELLAPGAHPGRLTVFSKAALEKMKKENLFF